MRASSLKYNLITIVALIGLHAHAEDWKKIDEGFFYKKIATSQKTVTDGEYSTGTLHVLQIDPKIYKLKIVTAKDSGTNSISAENMVKNTGAIAAINGGYFAPDFSSLGLLVQDGKQINKLKWISWWHVFKITNGEPQIVSKQEFALTPDINMAIQAGPRLVINGAVTQGLKPSNSKRTGIGITKEGNVIIAVTDNYFPSMTEFAKSLLEVGCYNALNLDGGSSTQIFTNHKRLKLDIPGFGNVANGIVVLPK